MRALFLAVKSRQNSYYPIGLLEKQGAEYLFRYTKGVETVIEQNNGCNPLQFQFPDKARIYKSDELFPLFSNRLMSKKRPDYNEHLEELGLENTPALDAFRILSVSLGKKVTDSYEVFPKLVKESSGKVECDFILHGVRHVKNASEHVARLKQGDTLEIHTEKEPHDATQPSVKVLTEQGNIIGYCPRYLVKDILAAVEHNAKTEDSPSYEFSVKSINGEAKLPKVVISMTAYLNGYEPMSSEEYQPIA